MGEDLTEILGKNIPLSEMVESLRQELAVAIEKGKGQAVKFVVERAEVEVKLIARRSVEGGGGVKFWVVSAEGKAALGEETSHRLTLSLRPVDGNTGGPVEAGR